MSEPRALAPVILRLENEAVNSRGRPIRPHTSSVVRLPLRRHVTQLHLVVTVAYVCRYGLSGELRATASGCRHRFPWLRSEPNTLARSEQGGHTKDREDGGGDAVDEPHRHAMRDEVAHEQRRWTTRQAASSSTGQGRIRMLISYGGGASVFAHDLARLLK